MTPPLARPAHRPAPSSAHQPVRVLLDVVLRAGGLVVCTEVLTSVSGETDALATGLTAFFSLGALSFAASMLDALVRRDRRRLCLVWLAVVAMVGLLETTSYLHMILTGPGAYPSLRWVSPSEIGGTCLLYAILVAVPAAIGIGLGVLIRTLPRTPAAPVRS